MDGELVCRVLQLMNLTDNRLAQGIKIILQFYCMQNIKMEKICTLKNVFSFKVAVKN